MADSCDGTPAHPFRYYYNPRKKKWVRNRDKDPVRPNRAERRANWRKGLNYVHRFDLRFWRSAWRGVMVQSEVEAIVKQMARKVERENSEPTTD